MGQIASGALDALFGGTPSINPDFIKGGYKFKDGQPIDADGNPTTIMTQPNLAQRMVSPTARARAQQNADLSSQFGLMAPLAQAQADTNKELWLKRQESNPWLSPNIAANPDRAYAQYGTSDNWNAATAEPILNASADIAANVPQANANSAYNTAIAKGTTAQNIASGASTAGLLGTPLTRALGEDTQAQNDLLMSSGEQPLIPRQLYNKGIQTDNDTTTLQGQRAALPSSNQELLNKVRLGADVSGQQLADEPYTLQGIRAGDISGLYKAKNPGGIYRSPFNASVDTESGTITPGVTPLGLGMQGKIAESSSDSGGRTLTTPDNKVHSVGSSITGGIDPLTGKDTRTSGHTISTISGEVPHKLTRVSTMPDYAYDEKGNIHHIDEQGNAIPIKVDKDSPIDAQVRSQRYLEKKREEGHNLTGLPHGTMHVLGKTAADTLFSPYTPMGGTLRSARLIGHGAGQLWDYLGGEQ